MVQRTTIGIYRNISQYMYFKLNIVVSEMLDDFIVVKVCVVGRGFSHNELIRMYSLKVHV